MDMPRLYRSLKAHEGVRQFPYMDTTGHLTIGCGRNLTDVGLSDVEIDYLLSHDIGTAVAFLNVNLPWVWTLDDVRQRAFVELVFNLGGKLLQFRKTLQAAQAKDWPAVSKNLLQSKWAHQVKPTRASRLATMLRTGKDPNDL